MNVAKRKALLETTKSILRGFWFAALGLVVVALTAFATSGAVSNTTLTIGGLTVNLAVIIVALVGFIAKSIDTYIHKNDNIQSNGLAPEFLQTSSIKAAEGTVVHYPAPSNPIQAIVQAVGQPQISTPLAIALPTEVSAQKTDGDAQLSS